MSQIIKRLFKKPTVRAFLGFSVGAASTYTYFSLSKASQSQVKPSTNIEIIEKITQVSPISQPVVIQQTQKVDSVPQNEAVVQTEQISVTVQEKELQKQAAQVQTESKGQQQMTQQSKSEVKNQSEALQVEEKKKEEEPTKTVAMERKVFKQLKDIAELDLEDLSNRDQKIMIVADLPYNEQFEAKIIEQVNRISQIYGDVKIYRKDLSKKEVLKTLQDDYKAKVKDQTIFLVRNPNENGLTNIDFDIFMQHPTMTETYLKDVVLYDESNIAQVTDYLKGLTPYESVLVYLYDKDQPEEKKKERMMAAKYIGLELILNRLPSVQVQAVEKSAAISSGLIDSEIARTNSIHLYRKHNIYTPLQPNFYLHQEGSLSVPFHRLADIALFARGSQNLMIQHYLASLQTFDAMSNPAPFMCTLRIDRNRVSQHEYNRVIRLFGVLRTKSPFSEVSYSIKLKNVPFSRKDVPTNKDWQITLSNVDEMDKEAAMHEIKTAQQLKSLGYKEDTYLKNSNEYLYEHTELQEDLLREFIQKGLKGQLPKYYKSEEDHPLAPIRGLVGSEFNSAVVNNEGDHFVYQYSEFCPTCKRISPIIGAFAKVIQEKGMGLENLTFHKLDANKNRVRGQLSSPYIPNIFYFKKEWKEKGPVRFPIDMLGSQGLISLYAFCSITNQIKTMNWSLVEQAIKTQQKAKDAAQLI